jgi:hypothetical protein
VKLPLDADGEAEIVSVELPEPVTELGEKLAVTPDGNPLTDSATVPVKPVAEMDTSELVTLPGTRVTVFGLEAMVKPVPVPVRAIERGTCVALLVMLTVPFLEPVPDGENTTFAVQEAPTARGNKAAQLSVSEKSPVVVAAILLICSVEVFVSVTCWDVLFVPTPWLLKLRDAGEAVSPGGITTTGILKGKLVTVP